MPTAPRLCARRPPTCLSVTSDPSSTLDHLRMHDHEVGSLPGINHLYCTTTKQQHPNCHWSPKQQSKPFCMIQSPLYVTGCQAVKHMLADEQQRHKHHCSSSCTQIADPSSLSLQKPCTPRHRMHPVTSFAAITVSLPAG
jgi:hypothetical protein